MFVVIYREEMEFDVYLNLNDSMVLVLQQINWVIYTEIDFLNL